MCCVLQEAKKRRKFERYRIDMQTALKDKVRTRSNSAKASITDILVSVDNCIYVSRLCVCLLVCRVVLPTILSAFGSIAIRMIHVLTFIYLAMSW